jgi:hypothetical protein
LPPANLEADVHRVIEADEAARKKGAQDDFSSRFEFRFREEARGQTYLEAFVRMTSSEKSFQIGLTLARIFPTAHHITTSCS